MRKLALLVFCLAPLGWGTPAHASTRHDLKVLKRQVRQLRAGLASTQADVFALDGFVSICLAYEPVVSRFGYQFDDGTGTIASNTAFDVAADGEAFDAFLVVQNIIGCYDGATGQAARLGTHAIPRFR